MTISVTHADILEPVVFGDYDVLITDPPYSPHVHANAASVGVLGGGMGAHARDLGFDALSDELRLMLAFGASGAKRWSVVFSDFEGGHAWREAMHAAELEYIRTVPWVRWSQPQLSGDRPCTGAEAVLLFHRQQVGPRGGVKPVAKHWNGPGSLTHFSRRAMRGQDKHPTEKPIDLMLDMVSWFSDPGETVLDPCAGSGTTVVACRLLERGCVAFERDKVWAAAAGQRAHGPLSDRDRLRAREWCESTLEEASSVPEPKAADGSDVKTYERAQRRLADAARVAEEVF
jgi:hypothetical protein